jgi:hypothetical protein
MGLRLRMSTRALAVGIVVTAGAIGLPTTAQALPPNRYQFYPANANQSATSSACATLNQSYVGTYRPKGDEQTVFGIARNRCTGTGGGYAYIYRNGSATGVINDNHAATASASVRLGSYKSSAQKIRGLCSIYDAPGNGGPNYYNHYMECVSRY